MAPPRFTQFAADAARHAWRVALACSLMPVVSACQRADRPLERHRDDVGLPTEEETTAPATAEEQAAFVGPPLPGPSDRADADSDAAAASAPPAFPAEDSDALLRADGRPTWWLGAPVRESGRVIVTAEAMGADARAARAVALEGARAALARETGSPALDFRVEAYLARPLAVDAPGRARVVGYVRASARE